MIRIVKKVLDKEGVKSATLSIVFVTNRKIQSINKKFLRKDRPTDVIAFDLSDEEVSRSSRKVRDIEGEIIVSATTASVNAKRFKTSEDYEVALYVVHGLLHLLGYDDHKNADIKKIRNKEKKLMELVF